MQTATKKESPKTNANSSTRGGSSKNARTSVIQPKLKVGAANDSYEQEADRMAELVTQSPVSSQSSNPGPESIDGVQRKPLSQLITPLAQRKPIEKEEPEEKPSVTSIQRKSKDDEDEVRRQGEGHSIDAKGIESRLHNSKGRGNPLPEDIRSLMESRFEANFKGVRIHTDASAIEMNGILKAQAFTHGNDIYFNQGRYNPYSQSGQKLLAHELAHTLQQNYKNNIRRKENPQADFDTPQDITSLSTATFLPGNSVKEYLASKGDSGGKIKVRLGGFATGVIKVRKKGELYETVGAQSIPIKLDFLKPLEEKGIIPILVINIDKSIIQGFATIKVGEKSLGNPNDILKWVQKNTEAMGWFGMDEIKVPKEITNEIREGKLHLGSDSIPVRVGGFIDANLNLTLVNDAVTFEVDATVNVPRLKPTHLKISRNAEGQMSGSAQAAVDIANFNGAIDVKYLDGIVDIKGVVGYNTEKMRGKIHIIVTDLATAKNVARQQIGPENIAQSKADNSGEKDAKPKPKTGKRALAGWGEVDFSFTDWMTGKAKVIVDHKGDITVFGEITPPNEVELFPQRDFVRPIFVFEIRATYGIPLLGSAFFFANIGMDALAKIGPGKLYNISVKGRYSTDPQVFNKFTIQGTMNISAFAGARIRAEGGIGIEIIAHDIKVGVGVQALAGIRGYVEATPTIGFREKSDPKEGKKGEYFIRGYMEIAAQPFMGLGGDLFVELDAPWWSPIFDKTWTWPLGDLEYPLPGEFGLGANLDYVIGSDQVPEIQFDEISFDKDKFMSDLMNDKVPKKKSSDGENQGKFEDGKKKPGLNKPKVKGQGGKKDDKGMGKHKNTKPLTEAELKDWQKGIKALGKVAKSSENKPLDEAAITSFLQKVKRKYQFTSLEAIPEGQEWSIKATKGSATNKDKPIKVKGIIPPGREKEKIEGESDPKDANVKAGLADVKKEEQKYITNGKITQKEAQRVAKAIKKNHPVFSKFIIIDGIDRWNYRYAASPEVDFEGKIKDKQNQDILNQTKEAKKFQNKWFKKQEVIDHLISVFSMEPNDAKNLFQSWRDEKILSDQSSSKNDPLKKFSFHHKKERRKLGPGISRRQVYGFGQNVDKDSRDGLKVMKKGFDHISISKTIDNLSEKYNGTKTNSELQKEVEINKERKEWLKSSALFHNPHRNPNTFFGWDLAIMGHDDNKHKGASGFWNEEGHTQHIQKNKEWNKNPDNYWGPEHAKESSASGSRAERYRDPSPMIESHEMWYSPEHKDWPGHKNEEYQITY